MITVEEMADAFVQSAIADLPEETRPLIMFPPAKGGRRDRMLEIANHAAAAGWDNHKIIALLEFLADEWDVLPSTNLYKRYERILSMVRNARRHHGPAAGCGALPAHEV